MSDGFVMTTVTDWPALVARLIRALSYCCGVIDASEEGRTMPPHVAATLDAAIDAMGAPAKEGTE
jgi:hypothetical protein